MRIAKKKKVTERNKITIRIENKFVQNHKVRYAFLRKA
ncbi:hypothetical protein MNB_SV-5-417 [hydrothermal vent metagenome]|uniref:Uncharacterized protein n=1 Tax=hydrothermal vent metagenome TaxID=652676 RepID=A0A1W1EF14_9ZZZZ